MYVCQSESSSSLGSLIMLCCHFWDYYHTAWWREIQSSSRYSENVFQWGTVLGPVPILPLLLDLNPNPRFCAFLQKGRVSQYLQEQGGVLIVPHLNDMLLSWIMGLTLSTSNQSLCMVHTWFLSTHTGGSHLLLQLPFSPQTAGRTLSLWLAVVQQRPFTMLLPTPC